MIVCLLAGVSVALAAESPAEPQTSDAAAAESEVAAPPAAAEAEVAAETAEPAIEPPSAAAEEPLDPVEAARIQAEKEKAEDREFSKAGYKPTTVKGQKKYCEVYDISGSRVSKKTQCFSAEQVRAKMAAQAEAQKR